MTTEELLLPLGLALLSLLSPVVGPAQDNTLAVGQVAGSPGLEVAVPLRLEVNADSLAALDPVVAFDDELVEVVEGSGDCDFVEPGIDLGEHGVYCSYQLDLARIVFDPPESLPIAQLATGEIAILRLRVLDTVAVGTTVPIEFAYLNASDDSGTVLDGSSFNLQAGSIEVLYATTTEITSISPPSGQESGLPYEVDVEVTGESPEGQIQVSDGVGGVCTIDLPDTSCSLSTEAVGGIKVTASYQGSNTHIASDDQQSYVISPRSTELEVVSIVPAGSQTAGSPYLVTAEVSPASATGEVVVFDGYGAECSIELPQEQCELTSFQASVSVLELEYSGDATHAGSSVAEPYQIVPDTPDHLDFDQQPTDVVAGEPFADAIVVSLRDQYNNVVTSDSSTLISLSLNGGTGSATLIGLVEVALEDGVAEFSPLAVDRSGEDFRLEASAPASGLESEASLPFDVVPNYVSRDRFELEPARTTPRSSAP